MAKKETSKKLSNHKPANDGLYDDCPICQAMREGKAETLEDLTQAFRKAVLKHPEQTFINEKLVHGLQTPEIISLGVENDLYYDAMELLNNGRGHNAKQLLLKAFELNPYSVQTLVGLTAVYQEKGAIKKASQCIDLAFNLTQQKFTRWPKEMPWGILENREYLRAIANKASDYHLRGEKAEAEWLYRVLLKLNPNDNQGIRYLLAGLYANIGQEEVDEYMEEGNQKQNWKKIETLLKKQNTKYRFWREPSQ